MGKQNDAIVTGSGTGKDRFINWQGADEDMRFQSNQKLLLEKADWKNPSLPYTIMVETDWEDSGFGTITPLTDWDGFEMEESKIKKMFTEIGGYSGLMGVKYISDYEKAKEFIEFLESRRLMNELSMERHDEQ